MSKVYAVRKGRITGIFEDWDSCQQSVNGFSGAEFKSFSNPQDAEAYLQGDNEKGVPNVSSQQAIAYVDGSYDANTHRFSFGAVILWDGKRLTFFEAFTDDELASMRNVAGEIKGAEFAMRWAADHGVQHLHLYYDYQGIENWCTGAWRTTKRGTMDYAKFYTQVSKSVAIHFHKVAAHTGVPENEEADRLAKNALFEEGCASS